MVCSSNQKELKEVHAVETSSALKQLLSNTKICTIRWYKKNLGTAESDSHQIKIEYDLLPSPTYKIQDHSHEFKKIALYPLQKVDAFTVFSVKIYQNKKLSSS